MALIFLTVMLDLMSYGIVLPLLPFYVQAQQGGAAAAGLLGSVYALTQFFSGPLLGTLSDRYGRRPVLVGCMMGTAAAYLILGTAGSLAFVFLAVMIDGATGGNLTTAYAYIADITSPQQRSRGMGLVGAAFGIGLMIGPALGGVLSRYGLAAPAFAAAGVAVLNITIAVLKLPESLPVERRSASLKASPLNAFAQLSALFGLAHIRSLLLGLFVLNLAFSGLQTNFPLFSQARFGWDSFQNGVFFAYVGLCAVFIQGLLYGWVQPRLGERRLSGLGLALMSLGLVGMAAARREWNLYPLVGIVALGSGLSIPSLSGLASRRVEAGAQGRLMGGMQAMLSVAMISGPALAGLAFERLSVGAPYWLGGLLAALALLIVLPVLRPGGAEALTELQ
jgi:DHA1 family tetracycline resistance protein-like MFS transporter